MRRVGDHGIGQIGRVGDIAHGRMVLEGLLATPRPVQVGGCQHRGGRPHRHRLTGQQQGQRKMRPYRGQVVQHHDLGAPLFMPAMHEGQQIVGGSLVHRGKGFVQQQGGGVLQHQAGKEGPLELTARQRVEGSPLETLQSHRGNRLGGPFSMRLTPPAQRAHLVPKPRQHEFLHAEGKRPVDVGGLGQIGHTSAPQPVDVPARQRHPTRQRLEQGGLPGAVGAHDRHQAAGGPAYRQVMDRRMAFVADRQVFQHNIGARVAALWWRLQVWVGH